MEKQKFNLKFRLIYIIIFGFIAFLLAFILGWQEKQRDTLKDIEKVESKLEQEFANIGKVASEFTDSQTGEKRKLVYIGPSWELIDKITGSLTYANERISKAKALIRLDENPIQKNSFLWSDLWDNRFEISKQSWKIETVSSKILRSLGYGVISFIIIVVIILLLPHLWRFILYRISELSRAIQGRINP